MERLKQKEFFWGTALTVGSTALMMGQGSAQSAQSEEQAAQQEEQSRKALVEQRRQNELLNRIANKSGPNNNIGMKAANVLSGGNGGEKPIVRGKFYSSVLSRRGERMFAAAPSIMSKIGTAAKDIYGAGKDLVANNIKGTIAYAGMASLAAYGANKYIQHDMKKEGLDVDDIGNLAYKKQKSYASSSAESVVNGAAKGVEKQSFLSHLKSPMGIGISAAFEIPRVFDYSSEKNQLKEMVGATGRPKSIMQQRSYAAPTGGFMQTVRNIPKNLKGWWAGIKSHPGESITNGISFIGTAGFGGTKATQEFAGNLASGSKSESMRKFGKWMQNHKALANLTTLAPSAAIGIGGWNVAQGAGDKALRTIDPNAYKYQDAKNRQLEMMRNVEQ